MASTRQQHSGRPSRGSRGSGAGSARSTGGTRGRRPVSGRTRTASAPSRPRAVRRRLIAMLSVATVLGLAYVLLFSSLLGVDSVRVEGSHSLPASQVRTAASIEHGKPLLRVDTVAIRDRVGALTALSSVQVSRSWPSTIVISVTERTAVAVLDTGQGFRLVDRSGVMFRTVAEKPKGLPVLELSQAVRQDRARSAAAAAVAALPDQLRTRVTTVGARGEHTVHLILDDGTKVIWGSADRSERKARVLAALMTRPGSVYDVSTPALPTIQ